MQTLKIAGCGLMGGLMLFALSKPEEKAELAARGKELFDRRCSGCHAADINKEGPRLRGVYGRKAAGLSEFGYSDAIKKLDVRWDESSLDRWLKDPDAMAPDTEMGFKVTDAKERKAIVIFLKGLGER